MNKIYFVVLLSAVVFGAYFYGVNITKVKCSENNLIQNQKQQESVLQNKRIIHERVYKTSLSDIRRILHNEYTIAE